MTTTEIRDSDPRIAASSVRLEKRPDGVGLLIFDTPGSPVNVLSDELFGEIGSLLDEIAADDAGSAACVILSLAKQVGDR